METGIGMRIAGTIAALLLGAAPMLFLLGPTVFEGMPLHQISLAARVGAGACGLFGTWLLIVSWVAPLNDLKRVLEPFEGGEAVLLFLPYMLFVGTRAIWRGISHHETNERP